MIASCSSRRLNTAIDEDEDVGWSGEWCGGSWWSVWVREVDGLGRGGGVVGDGGLEVDGDAIGNGSANGSANGSGTGSGNGGGGSNVGGGDVGGGDLGGGIAGSGTSGQMSKSMSKSGGNTTISNFTKCSKLGRVAILVTSRLLSTLTCTLGGRTSMLMDIGPVLTE